MQPSINVNAGTTSNIFLPNISVNKITKKDVISIFGNPCITTLHASIIPTAKPIKAISRVVIFLDIAKANYTLTFCIYKLKCIAVSNNLLACTIHTIFSIYHNCPVSTVSIPFSFFAVYCNNCHSIRTVFTCNFKTFCIFKCLCQKFCICINIIYCAFACLCYNFDCNIFCTFFGFRRKCCVSKNQNCNSCNSCNNASDNFFVLHFFLPFKIKYQKISR